jgi:transposase, IS605 OrfB family, central region
MIRAHKIRLYPNNVQTTYFTKACGVARFAYNWALGKVKDQYKEDPDAAFNEAALRRELNAVKEEKYPWMLEVSKCAPQLAIKNGLNSAFKNFFANRAAFPTFHKKGVNDSFSLSNDQFKIRGRSVKIPKLGWVRLAEELRFTGKILGATISRKADKWHIAIQIEIPVIQLSINKNHVVGVDLGVKNLAALSDGTVITGSKASRMYGQKLRRLNQSLSRKQGAKKGESKSKNYLKTKKQLSRLHAKIADIRSDETHKLTTMLTQNYRIIGIEDLNVKGMMSNHKLARSVADMSFFEFRRQLEYKAECADVKVVIVDQWYPSSKTCHVCGVKTEELTLSMREWTCVCGASHNRDVNAAINIKNYALQNA